MKPSLFWENQHAAISFGIAAIYDGLVGPLGRRVLRPEIQPVVIGSDEGVGTINGGRIYAIIIENWVYGNFAFHFFIKLYLSFNWIKITLIIRNMKKSRYSSTKCPGTKNIRQKCPECQILVFFPFIQIASPLYSKFFTLLKYTDWNEGK